MTTEHCLRALSPVLCKGMANGSCLRDSGINPARFVEFLGCRRKKAPPVKQTTQFGYSVCFEKSSPASFCLCLRWQIKYLKAYRFFVKTGSHRARGEKKVAETVSTRIPPRRTLHSVCPLAGRMTFCGLGGEQQLGRTVAWKQEDYVLLLKSIPEALSARRWRSKLCLECFQEGIVSLKVL